MINFFCLVYINQYFANKTRDLLQFFIAARNLSKKTLWLSPSTVSVGRRAEKRWKSVRRSVKLRHQREMFHLNVCHLSRCQAQDWIQGSRIRLKGLTQSWKTKWISCQICNSISSSSHLLCFSYAFPFTSPSPRYFFPVSSESSHHLSRLDVGIKSRNLTINGKLWKYNVGSKKKVKWI